MNNAIIHPRYVRDKQPMKEEPTGVQNAVTLHVTLVFDKEQSLEDRIQTAANIAVSLRDTMMDKDKHISQGKELVVFDPVTGQRYRGQRDAAPQSGS